MSAYFLKHHPKYKTSTSEDYKKAIILIFKERGYTRLEIGQLLEGQF